MDGLKNIRRENIAEEVQEQMMNKIIDGTWAQGTKIPSENELREAMGVSRDTVRQAIKQLCAHGFLESFQGRGTYVKKIDLSIYLTHLIPVVFLSEDDGTNLLQFMQLIEAASAKAAARTATKEEIQYLETCLNEMSNQSDDSVYYKWDSDYHIQLAKCSHNPLYVRSIEITSKMLNYYLTDLAKIHGHAESILQHQQCLEAIIERNPEAAEKAMIDHYDMLQRRLLTLTREV